MKEIKFRVFKKDTNFMFDWDDILTQGWRFSDIFLDKTVEVMQYTGLKDKNGKEIYEGDILKTYAILSKEEIYVPVRWGDGCYISNGILTKFQSENSEIIGNIYESPELLNK